MSQGNGVPNQILIEDITQKVLYEITLFNDFPINLKINKVMITLEPDGFGSSLYFIFLEYEFDLKKYDIKRPVYSSFNETLNDILFEIVEHYRKMHPE